MHSSFFVVYKLSNMEMKIGNENSLGNENWFFTCDFMVVQDQFSWNLGSVPGDSILHYYHQII